MFEAITFLTSFSCSSSSFFFNFYYFSFVILCCICLFVFFISAHCEVFYSLAFLCIVILALFRCLSLSCLDISVSMDWIIGIEFGHSFGSNGVFECLRGYLSYYEYFYYLSAMTSYYSILDGLFVDCLSLLFLFVCFFFFLFSFNKTSSFCESIYIFDDNDDISFSFSS